MPSPATYAAWAKEANPKCRICRGLGYARYRPQLQTPVGSYLMRGMLPPESQSFEGACVCLLPTHNERSPHDRD